MAPAIRIENLGKRYVVDHERAARGEYRTLRETLVELAAKPLKRLKGEGRMAHEDFWALKDVSFEVQPGEVVGIIGRNGAGKSTLLKILSQITKPTNGRVELHGRLGSLLEVGTGFHPELTGRENVYLNGSILGMGKLEIDRKFDEIVEFSGVEQFLDTPVKRYSSGMYVRLAFAVAAHLEPEILIVDEVLAVGDAGFQRKCFDKLSEIRSSGRTVLVVSHNLGAVLEICTTAINLEQGKLANQGCPQSQVAWYLDRLSNRSRQDLASRTDREGDQTARIVAIEFRNSDGRRIDRGIVGEGLEVALRCHSRQPDVTIDFAALSMWTATGTKVFHVDNSLRDQELYNDGTYCEIVCRIPRINVPAGHYMWNALISGEGCVRDHIYSAASFEVCPGDFFRIGRNPPAVGGIVLIDHDWSCNGLPC